ncbi:hypothetical protein [Asanoa siamensis]|uniref:PknH-like extracellular domain-containing protein n=1 Tax=Asanoa siamensis TaxID=926357 RepID=A0ABQ4CR60_9ACTN|nr:hypothetical protein [Asanoa siamensis]GIF73752.1 hypothetical protein Asi02nite_32700 [Asanoa siamensis]
MPDDSDLAARIAADLGQVRWPAAEEIRRSARRRTRRSVLAASLSVLVLFTGVWVAATRPFDQPPATQPEFAAQPSLPEPVATTVGPGDPAWIPPEALLGPEDVGAGLVVSRVEVDQDRPVDGLVFALEPCPAYPKVRTYQGAYQFRRQQTVGYPPKVPGQPETAMAVLHQTVLRLPDGGARELMTEAVRGAEVCGKYVSSGTLSATNDEAGGAVVKQMKVETAHTWSLLDRGFAGDDSLLFEHRMTAYAGRMDTDLGVSTVVVLRVGDLVATVEQVNGDPPDSTRKLATRAAAWLCTAATPPC